MDKPKALSIWTIARNTCTGRKCVWYGSFDEFIEYGAEDYDDRKDCWIEIPFENWLSEDLVEIFGNELEDGNYHHWTWLPESLQHAMIINKLPEKERFDILLKVYNDWLYN